MKRAFALPALLLTVAVVAAGCHSEVKSAPNPINEKLAEHQQVLKQLRMAQMKFVTSLEGFERQKAAYEKEVAAQMATSRADKRAISQIEEMTRDVDRIGQEIIQSVTALAEALISRAEGVERAEGLEAQLIDTETTVFGNKDAAAGRAVVEAKYLHEVESDLRIAQKDQQLALATLTNKEIEAWMTIGADPKARDVADGELLDLRNKLNEAFAKLLDWAQRFEEAADRMHRKIQVAAVAKDGELGTRIQGYVDRRAAASKELASSRDKLKLATLDRAEKRAHEVAYDGEFDYVLAGAFPKEAFKVAFLARVAPLKKGVDETRLRMQQEEKALAEVRKRLVQLEADMSALGY